MSNTIHPLTFSNFLSNHIINTNSEQLSATDQKIALVASIIIGIFTIGTIHWVVFLGRLALCGRVNKTPKPNKKPTAPPKLPTPTSPTPPASTSVKPKSSNSDQPKNPINVDPKDIPKVPLRRANSNYTSTKLTKDKLVKDLLKYGESSGQMEIYVADITENAFVALKAAVDVTSIKLVFGDGVPKLPDYVKLAELDHITELEVHADSFPNTLAKKIVTMKGLKHLTLELMLQTADTALSFKTLKQMKQLESFTFGILAHFMRTDLKGKEVHINPLIFTNAFGIPGLKKLSIKRVAYLDDLLVKSLTSAKSLEELSFCCVDADVDAINRFGLAAYNKLELVELRLKEVDQDVYEAVNNLKKRTNKPVDIKVSPEFSIRGKQEEIEVLVNSSET